MRRTTMDAAIKSATFWASTPAARFSSASPSGSRENGDEICDLRYAIYGSNSPAARKSHIANRKSIRPVAENFHDAQHAAAPVNVWRESEHPSFLFINQFHRMFGNVRIVGFKFGGLLRLGEGIQHDSVIDGDARKAEQMHERHAAFL